MAERAIAELGGVRNLIVARPAPGTGSCRSGHREPRPAAQPARHPAGLRRRRQGGHPQGLRRRAVALGAPTRRSSHWTERSRTPPSPSSSPQAYPDRYFEMYIAEQQMVAAATGLAVRGYKPFASTFAAFFTRAHDFIRMGAISGGDLRLAGLARRRRDRRRRPLPDGPGGPGHDAGGARIHRAVPGRRHQHRRAGRGDGRHRRASATCAPPAAPTPACTRQGKPSPSAAPRCSAPASRTTVTLIGAGVTLHECLGAADQLAAEGIARPRHRLLLASSRSTPPPSPRRRRPPAGGSWSPKTTTPKAGSAQRSPMPCSPPGSSDLSVAHLAVREMPGSGTGAGTARLGRHRRRPHRRRRPLSWPAANDVTPRPMARSA